MFEETNTVRFRSTSLPGVYELILPEQLDLRTSQARRKGRGKEDGDLTFAHSISITNIDQETTRISIVLHGGPLERELTSLLLGAEVFQRISDAHFNHTYDGEVEILVTLSAEEWGHIKNMIEQSVKAQSL